MRELWTALLAAANVLLAMWAVAISASLIALWVAAGGLWRVPLSLAAAWICQAAWRHALELAGQR